MANIAEKAEQVIKECCKETDGWILSHPRKSVSFHKRFLTDDSTILRDGTKVIREFYIESELSGLVWLVMRLKDKPEGGIKLAMFESWSLSCKAMAKAMEAIIKTGYIANE